MRSPAWQGDAFEECPTRAIQSHESQVPREEVRAPEDYGTRFQERTIPQFREALFHSIARRTFANGHVMSVSPPASDMRSNAFSEH